MLLARRCHAAAAAAAGRPALMGTVRRGLANKVYESAEAAVKDIKDGSKL